MPQLVLKRVILLLVISLKPLTSSDHSIRQRLAPGGKGVFFNLSSLLFAVLRNGAWEIVHWEKVCVRFYFVAKEVHRGSLYRRNSVLLQAVVSNSTDMEAVW